jgi:bifunctional N-acetylglucosamine-1-phosphate-uridyltransferase/glucosamine-1-phosphate-acetyltransferase GlmU-like protein
MTTAHLSHFIASIEHSALAPWASLAPWQLTAQSEAIVRQMRQTLDASQFRIDGEVAIHRTAVIEQGVTLKGPLIVGAHAYFRGGCWIAEGCSIGPGCELKSSFLFAQARLAHFNFVGDTVVGRDVNLEAGSIVCNHRNERDDKTVRVRIDGKLVSTGVNKFGAVLGDGCRVGANAVIAPGALLAPGTIIARTALRDDELDAARLAPAREPVDMRNA